MKNISSANESDSVALENCETRTPRQEDFALTMPAESSPTARKDEQPSELLKPERKHSVGLANDLASLLTLPNAQRSHGVGAIYSFALMVVVPTILVGLYFVFVASNQYASTFQFSVTEVDPVLPGGNGAAVSSSSSGGSGMMEGLASALGGGSISTPTVQNYLVINYVTSHQAVEDLQRQINLKALFSNPDIDFFSRFNPNKPAEKFDAYWRNKVDATFDPETGLAEVDVRAFSPKDAYLIAENLISTAESLLNDIERRANQHALDSALNEYAKDQSKLNSIQAKLTQFRDVQSVIDPTQSAVPANAQIDAALKSNLVQLKALLTVLRMQNLDTHAPAIIGVTSQIASTEKQIAAVEAEIPNKQLHSRPLADVVSQFEQLQLDRQVAETAIAADQTAVAQARANADSMHLYLTPFVKPNVPQSATYPRGGWLTFYAALIFLGIWLLSLMVFRSVREHLA